MPTLEISQAKLELVKKAEEYYNALCTNLQLSGDDLKVFSITSVKAGEGKTTTSTNIAWAFARAGYKTLLMMQTCVTPLCQVSLNQGKGLLD